MLFFDQVLSAVFHAGSDVHEAFQVETEAVTEVLTNETKTRLRHLIVDLM